MAIVAAHAILLVGDRYALQLRDARAPSGAGTWGLFGGHLEAGEDCLQAVRREVLEELELELDTPEHLGDFGIWSFYVADVTAQWAGHVLHEGAAAGLFTFEEVQGLPRSKTVDEALALHRRAVAA